MNRRDLVAELAERAETDKRSADASLQVFIDIVTDTVAKGEPVAISGFAKFARRDVPAKPRRLGRNPATGEEIWLAPKPASKSVKITPLKAFKDAVLTGRRVPAKKKAAARKTTAKKTTAKKTTARKAPARKTTARKTTARKTTARKTTARKTTRR